MNMLALFMIAVAVWTVYRMVKAPKYDNRKDEL
jgi:molybdenum cofactor biosynthesis enzyme